MTIQIDRKGPLAKICVFLGLAMLAYIVYGVGIYINGEQHIDRSETLLSENDSTERIVAQQSLYQAPDVETDEVQLLDTRVEESEYDHNMEDGEVLAAGGSGCNGAFGSNRQGCVSESIAYQPVCTQVEANINTNGGNATDNGNGTVSVNKNAKIEVWKVTAPLAILSGSEYIPDNTFSITGDDPVVKSANDLIDQHYVARAARPPTELDDIDAVRNNADTGDFAINVSTNFGGQPDAAATNKATVQPELDTMCSNITTADPNPDTTNKVSRELAQAYRPPTEQLTSRQQSSDECVFIDPSDIDLPSSDVFETCVDQRSAFDGFYSFSLSVQQYAECATNPDACSQVDLVGLLLDAPFGSNTRCEDGFCADIYFDSAVASRTDPVTMLDITDKAVTRFGDPAIQSHYITTPCKVRVDFKDIYDIPCLWDISPYKAIYDTQASVHAPGDPDFPTWEEYWAAVEANAEERAGQCYFN